MFILYDSSVVYFLTETKVEMFMIIQYVLFLYVCSDFEEILKTTTHKYWVIGPQNLIVKIPSVDYYILIVVSEYVKSDTEG